jgi:D-3-phosphoglycerate dehydrogenase / 2-oxoglutarate reductase
MQNRHKVVVVGGLSPQAMALFEARDDIVTEVIPRADDAELLVRIGDASGVTMRTGRLTREMIEKAPRLQVVARHGVGYDNVDVET